MRYNLSRILGVVVGIPVATVSFIASTIGLDIQWIFDLLIGGAGFVLGYVPTQRLSSKNYLNELGLSRKDYRYIHHQMNVAQGKVKRIFKSFINVRSIQDFKLVNDIYRLARTINQIVRQKPNQFYQIESFYYSHIDHALNLIENYTHLSKMPMKSAADQQALYQTRITLEEIKRTLIADLKRVNEPRYNQLDTEMRLSKLYLNEKNKEHANDTKQ
ncbi:5-bromo-4-chloroindolyl phosphate hydrolase [Staphylococcus muscae]|uniref:5-bromo-4-chloroindolyl phosphate hydrolysis protein n=1 Tax=Staphylococcus muscae TaxID=1294 RepID=A0A240C407_9STAP|nr:5-bromo-4-chloroindolyl phosphate hydrolysis family protein [Staphylococcus muscae]AVQ33198.1 5-bromo-4-chloroindolyl phosphate hydrolase [Staphylococcus muscae]PNZ01092.1 5-bromo-4-chloroindolyl phosphate hydrolase [Staphylococcus muscae]GGA93850.1 5-bromo-4-chloroindolyl phosphate hydrolysis protein [Staphylococcus muscae]SNW02747.1 5-bromo-4-chloroindolyl phosphate hydrolysis protein XpaC [Staphylococcus muscae]